MDNAIHKTKQKVRFLGLHMQLLSVLISLVFLNSVSCSYGGEESRNPFENPRGLDECERIGIYHAMHGYEHPEFYEKAIRELTEALELILNTQPNHQNSAKANPFKPTRADLLMYRAIAWAGAHKYSAAIQDNTALLNLVPDHLAALRNRASAYCALHDFKSAIHDYDRDLKINGPNKALLGRAIAYLQLKDPTKASADLQEYAAHLPFEHDPCFFYVSASIKSLNNGAKGCKQDLLRALAIYKELHLPKGVEQVQSALKTVQSGSVFIATSAPECQ